MTLHTPFKFRRRSPSSLYIPHNLSRNIQFYLSNCGMGGRITRPGQRFSDAGPLTLLAALSGNHVIPIRRR
jgi:hypothetical protein